MPVGRLLATDRGKILLVNAYDMAQSNLLPKARLRLAIRGLKAAVRSLPDPYCEATLVNTIGAYVYPHSSLLHANGTEYPDEDIHFAVVRTFDDVAALLRRIQKSYPNDRSVRRALLPRASDKIRVDAARIVNDYTARLQHLTIGGPYNFFWATTRSQLREIEHDFMSAMSNNLAGVSPEDLANYVRDVLGLSHIQPDYWGCEKDIYAFETIVTLKQIRTRVDFRSARPTTIDGFDNPRFRQLLPVTPRHRKGFGLTVDLADGKFADGVPEVVSTEIPLFQNFVCRWLGKVSTRTEGEDGAFVQFLRNGRDLQSMTDYLNTLR